MRSRTNSDDEFRQQVAEQIQALRPFLRRVILVVNGKGGTGKTTTCANLLAVLAGILHDTRSAKRVLGLEFDPQANLAIDLGIVKRSENDGGSSILNVVMGGGKLSLIRDARPNLDIVPCGDVLNRLDRVLSSSNDRERIESWIRFAQAIAEIASDYEWIIIDCPPGNRELQKLAAAVARWALVPTTFDLASRQGLEKVGELFDEVSAVNEELDVLAVLMFAFDRKDERVKKDVESGDVLSVKEVGQRARLRKELERDLKGTGVTILQSVIGNSRTAAEACRKLGYSASELADLVQGPQWPKVSKQLEMTIAGPTAEAYAADYENAVQELFSLAAKKEVEVV